MTLALDYEGLRQRVGFQLGYRRDVSLWEPEETATVEDCISSGLRRFYWPEPVQGTTHQWSFLKPTEVLSLDSGASEVLLPDDYSGLEGEPTIETTDTGYCPLKVVGEGMIRAWRTESPALTGSPHYVAESYQRAPGVALQRVLLLLFPTTDQAYSLRIRYRVTPNMVTRTSRFPWGGVEHAETILESCLAIAERRVDGQMGAHEVAFQQRLAASLALDQRRAPDYQGGRGWSSDRRGSGNWRKGQTSVTITLNGEEI